MTDVKGIESNVLHVEQYIEKHIEQLGVSHEYVLQARMLTLIILVLIISYIAGQIAIKISMSIFYKLAKKTKNTFDDHLVEHKTIAKIAMFVPYVIVYNSIGRIFADFPGWLSFFKTALDAYAIIMIIRIIRSFLRAGRDYLETTESFKDKPLQSFMQLIMIFLYIAGGLILFSILTGKSVIAFLTAMGAASAVLLLVFRDTILGFVASIQVSINDMVRIGDWISMEKYNADGDVVEINLATVKVQNWDKTITTIPTYFLISDSFKNWRGMQQAGGRRIKRSLYIKISSVRHLRAEDINGLMEIQLIKPYLEETKKEIEQYNKDNNINEGNLVNGRHLTNVGVFRKYMDEYIKQHPDLDSNMTMMIRQLEPTTKGMAVELYAFANKIEWVTYEGIMSDIFDHLMACVPKFKLEIFEEPTSSDIRYLKIQEQEETTDN